MSGFPDAPNRICFEPHPSLFLGENTAQQCYLQQNLSCKLWNRQGMLVLPIFFSDTLHNLFGAVSKTGYMECKSKLTTPQASLVVQTVG